MKVYLNLYRRIIPVFTVILFSSEIAFAHPHHENDLLGSLGLDHLFYGLVLAIAAFFFFGKTSR